MENVIELKNVDKEFKVLNRREGLKGSFRDLFSRDYKIVKAVNGVSMEIKPGEIVGYLGPNGAGKSTTIKMMTGVLQPTRGEITVNGKRPYKNRTENAQNIGVVFGQRSQLWWSLPLIESFKILKSIYRIPDEEFNGYRQLVENGEIPVTTASVSLKKGMKVRIVEGSLKGLEAYVQRFTEKKAVIGNEIRFVSGATIEISRELLETVEE